MYRFKCVTLTIESSMVTKMLWNGICVGKAVVSINDKRAILQDIIIYDRVPLASNWLRRLLWKPRIKSFRGKGLGSVLLKTLIEEIRLKQVTRIEGDLLRGDIERLARWYSRNGFDVDSMSNKISMKIGTD